MQWQTTHNVNFKSCQVAGLFLCATSVRILITSIGCPFVQKTSILTFQRDPSQ